LRFRFARVELYTPTRCFVPSYQRLDWSLAKEAYMPMSLLPFTPQESRNFSRLIGSTLKNSSSPICQASASAGNVARGFSKPNAEKPSRRTEAVKRYVLLNE